MNHLANWITRRPLWVWTGVVLFSVVPALGWAGYRWIEPEADQWASERELAALMDSQETFDFQGFPCVLLLECDDFFTPRRLQALSGLVEQFESRDDLVHRLAWFGRLPRQRGFQTRPLIPPGELTDVQAAEVRERALEHPLIAGQLLSHDADMLLLPLVPFSWHHAAVDEIRGIAADALSPVGIRVRMTGIAPLRSAYDRAFEREHMRILLTAGSLIVFLAFVIFRRPAAIVIACSGPAVGLFWSMGWLWLLGEANNELSQIIVPVMLLLVGFTDSVHLVVHFRQSRDAGEQVVDAAASAVRHVGLACLLTSVTTGIGFASLLLADSEVIQGFARAAVVGVVFTFLAVVTVVPLACRSRLGLWAHPRPMRSEGERPRVMLRFVGVIEFVLRHPRKVSLLGILLTVALTLVAARLRPDDRLKHRIPNDSEAYQALVDADRGLGGIRFLQVLIEWPEELSRNDQWTLLESVEELLASEELISRPVSIRTWLELLPGADRPAKLAVARRIPAEYRQQLWVPDQRAAQVLARIQDVGMVEYEPVFERLQAGLVELQERYPGVRMELTGDAVIEGRVVQRVASELFRSLLVAGGVILLVIGLALRSWKLGLISVVPNLFPLVATGALRALLDSSLDISSACSFSVALGIAVDDTIHFLTRYESERRRGLDITQSLRESFLTVGAALVMTTVVMVAGFATVLTSQLPTHVLFAAMACTTLGAALIADLVLLPALLAWSRVE